MTIITALQILAGLLVLVLIGIGIWANMAKPTKSIVKKYSRKTQTLATLPFYRSWDRNIDASDLAAFTEYRRRMLILYTATFTVFLTIALAKQLIVQSIINNV
jgi:hypothetical protein